MLIARVRKILDNGQGVGHKEDLWVEGETTGPEKGYVLCILPVRMASDPDKFKGEWNHFVTYPVQKVIKTGWGYIFRCRDGIWSLTWQ